MSESPESGPGFIRDLCGHNLIRRLRRIDLRNPLQNAALEVLNSPESLLAHEVHGLGTPHPRPAMDDDVGRVCTARHFIKPLRQLAQRNQRGTLYPADLELELF